MAQPGEIFMDEVNVDVTREDVEGAETCWYQRSTKEWQDRYSYRPFKRWVDGLGCAQRYI